MEAFIIIAHLYSLRNTAFNAYLMWHESLGEGYQEYTERAEDYSCALQAVSEHFELNWLQLSKRIYESIELVTV